LTNTPDIYINYNQTKMSGIQNNDMIDFSVKISSKDDYEEYLLCLTAKQPVSNVTFGIESDIQEYERDDFLMVPGAVYAQNRFKIKNIPYPPCFDSEDYGLNCDPVICDIPHFGYGKASQIRLRAGDSTVPAIALRLKKSNTGYIFLYEPKSDGAKSESGVIITEGESLNVKIEYPVIRKNGRYQFSRSSSEPCGDKPLNLKKGEEVTFKIRCYEFECESVSHLYDKMFSVKNALSKRGRSPDFMTFHECYKTIENKYNKENFENKNKFYKVGTGSSVYDLFQAGWVGGGMRPYTFFKDGNDLSKKNSRSTLDFLFEKVQTKSGLFYGIHDGKKPYGDNFNNKEDKGFLLIRKSADLLYFLSVTFLSLRANNKKTAPLWEDGLKKCADAFVDIWQKYGEFGQFVNAETNEILVGGSTSASFAPAGLALYSEYSGDKAYLNYAEQTGEYYYNKFICAGYTNGGPGEILSAPDSESAYGLFESMVVLYEITGNKKYLNYAENTAKYLSTWCVCYDYIYSEGSEFFRRGISTTGAVFANCQNKHGAPGFCTHSGSALLRLYLYTKNKAYLELICDVSHCITQFLSHPQKIMLDYTSKPLPYGYMCERVNTCDWEDYNMIGEIFNGSNWCEVSALMTFTDLPGIVIDGRDVHILDHFEAELLGDSLKIHNPTPFDSTVKILVTNSNADYKKLLIKRDYISLSVKSSESITVKI